MAIWQISLFIYFADGRNTIQKIEKFVPGEKAHPGFPGYFPGALHLEWLPPVIGFYNCDIGGHSGGISRFCHSPVSGLVFLVRLIPGRSCRITCLYIVRLDGRSVSRTSEK